MKKILIVGVGTLNFDEFCRVAVHFSEEDDEALQKELKEAFRLYDKEGEINFVKCVYGLVYIHLFFLFYKRKWIYSHIFIARDFNVLG